MIYQQSYKACPRFLYKGNAEYNFWMNLLPIYSPIYQEEFEERVNRSSNGYISWDFLFEASPTTTYVSVGNDYLDVLEIQYRIFDIVQKNLPSTLGFTLKNMETLESLAAQVEREITNAVLQVLSNSFSNGCEFIDPKRDFTMWTLLHEKILTTYLEWKPKNIDGALRDRIITHC